MAEIPGSNPGGPTTYFPSFHLRYSSLSCDIDPSAILVSAFESDNSGCTVPLSLSFFSVTPIKIAPIVSNRIGRNSKNRVQCEEK